MNCSKIFPPLPTFINFYFYFSYFSLFLSLLITPLTFYVILTQSKNLKNFKWLVLNHTIWCILFEILFTTMKPLVLPPALAGFPIGILRNGSLKISAFIFYIIFLVISNSVGALGTTLLCRYLLVFPATKWFNMKYGIYFTMSYIILAYFIFIIIFYPFLIYDSGDFFQMALKYDPCLQNYFNEPGFIFLSTEMSKILWNVLFLVISSILFMAILLEFYFIFLVKTNNNSVTTTMLSNSLMISAIFQLSFSIFFYFIPMTIFIGIIAFEISHMENLLIFLFCCLSTHSFLESLATLYFVTPYRKCVIKLFSKVVSWKPARAINPVNISTARIFVVNNYNNVNQ